MARSPVPGETRVKRVFGGLLAISDVMLETSDKITRVEAVLDTGSTFCIISPAHAASLDLRDEDRTGTQRNMIAGGRIILMDRYRLDSIRVGTAKAYEVDILVGDALPQFMLIGMSFIGKFTTTVDLDESRVLFRPRTSH